MYKVFLLFVFSVACVSLMALGLPYGEANNSVYLSGLTAANSSQPKTDGKLEMNAYDRDWYVGQGYAAPDSVPPFNDPHDLNAEILKDGQSFEPPIYTPYVFGGENGGKQPNHPFLPGLYSLSPSLVHDTYTWIPTAFYIMDVSVDQSLDFLGDMVVETTPVELSSFTAILTSQNDVQISWVSQTETNMLGYRVYRSETELQAGSLLITPVLIPATNTSEEHIYSHTDNEVAIGQTYYYWLECVDPASSEFNGPVSVLVQVETGPSIPYLSSMRNAYPNPFKASSITIIEVGLKAGETGTVTIYNICGQVVRTFSVTEGTHTVYWNGLDNRGVACGSGLYYYKLSTPTLNQTKKLVMIK